MSDLPVQLSCVHSQMRSTFAATATREERISGNAQIY